MSSADLIDLQNKKKSFLQKIFKSKTNKKQKPHLSPVTQKRLKVKKSLEMAICEKNPQKAEEILFRCFEVLQQEDMVDLFIKSIIADEPECISYTRSDSSENVSQTLLHTIMKCTKSQPTEAKDWTPIHIAVKLMRAGATRYLLERQPSDVNLPTKSDLRPPLHLAIFKGSEAMVRLLIEYGADINSRDIYGNTALHAAVQFDEESIVKLLLSEGIKSIDPYCYVNTGNNDGWTPLHLAALRGKISTCKILLKYGAYVDCRTKSGKTPLHWASMNNNRETVSLLLEHAADLEATDRNDRMPFQYATSKAIKNIIDVSESRRSSKCGSLKSRKVSIRIDPRSRNYWQVSTPQPAVPHDLEKSFQGDTTTCGGKDSILKAPPNSTILINSFISSIDALQLPPGIKQNHSEPDLSNAHNLTNSFHEPISLTNSICSYRSLSNSSRNSEFYKRYLFSQDESGIYEQSIRDDDSFYSPHKTLSNDCHNNFDKIIFPVSYDQLTSLYKEINSASDLKKLTCDINPAFYYRNPFLELYTSEAITCVKNPGAAWISICQMYSDENDALMFFVGKMTAVFQDEHRDRCLCQICVEQLMLLISLFLFQGINFHQDHVRSTPIKKTSNLLALLFPGFSKRIAYEMFAEKFSQFCSYKITGNTTLGILLEKIEENQNKLNNAISNMARHIKSFVPPDVCPQKHVMPPLHFSEYYGQINSNQLVDLMATIAESGHEWIFSCVL